VELRLQPPFPQTLDAPPETMSLEALSYPSRQQPPQFLLVLLHGWGANAQDVAALASYLDLPNVQLYFPNAPFPFPYAPLGRMWYDLPTNYSFFSQPEFRQQPQVQESRQRLKDWLLGLEAVTGVPLNRTFLSGFSQGGAMTLDVGLELPLAALLILSGYTHAPLENFVQSKPPVLIAHGRLDQVVPLLAAQNTRDALLKMGVSVQYQEFNMGHEIQPLVLKLMQSFIEEMMSSPNSP
jgi:phospholipase/carboxylesterase